MLLECGIMTLTRHIKLKVGMKKAVPSQNSKKICFVSIKLATNRKLYPFSLRQKTNRARFDNLPPEST